MAMAYGCLAFCPLIAFHSKKPSTGRMHRRLPIGVPERREGPDGLAFGVDRLAATLRVLAPIRDEAPAQRIERYFAGLVVAPDHQQVLARRAVPPRRIVVHAAIANVHPVHDRVAYRRAALDDPPAHNSYMVTGSAVGNADVLLSTSSSAD